MSLLGTTIGRIRLVDLLGKGGMGEVFVGYDETLDRKVAVKCVRVGGRRDDKVKARFLQEARILSRLEHPSICQIYDFVEGDDRDFLVMELVEGRSLKQAIRDGLDEKAKLRIALRIADVLVAAHAEGVVHRDLKPEHVVITGEGEVKILDFGVAHSVAADGDETATMDFSSGTPAAAPTLPAHRTAAGSLVGTPRYMSPEQARREPVTPASDMYTFGLLLQEIFTGQPPYAKKPMTELLDDVAGGRSRSAVGLGRRLTELIEGLKALTPGHRPTAREAADRLRFIRDTPLRWLRRGAAAAALLLIVAAAVKYTVDLRRERSAAIAARNQAVAARNQAEDLVAFMLDDLSRELRPVGKLEVLGKVARKALDYYEHAPAAVGQTAFGRGHAFYSAAEVLDAQGELEAALEASKAATEIHRRLVAESPDRAEWRNQLALDHLQLGGILRQQGEREGAHGSLIAGREIAGSLVELDPGDTRWRRSLGEAYYGLGMFHVFSDPEAGAAAFQQAIALYRQLAEADPSESAYRYRLAVLHGQGLGQAYQQLGRETESFAAVSQAYALYQQVTEADPSNNRWQHGFAWENRRMGQHLEEQGRSEAAADHYRQAMEITERLLDLEPSNVDWQLGLGADHGAIGGIRESQGDLTAALVSYRRALEISRRLVETDPTRADFSHYLAGDHLAVGSVLARLGRLDDATTAWRQAEALLAPRFQRPDAADLDTLELYALALLYLGRTDDARPVVGRLAESGWLGSSASEELVELCRRHGLLAR